MTAYDVAENYPTKDETLVPAEVVSIDNTQSGPFVKRGNADESLLGVVSTAPAVLMGGFNGREYKEEKQVAVALSGRVPVKISLENGPIKAGDYLTSSSTPGAAMRATKAGRVIGMALEDYGFDKSQIPNPKSQSNPNDQNPNNQNSCSGLENCDLKIENSLPEGKVAVFVNPHWYGGELTAGGALADADGEIIVAALTQSQSFKDLVKETIKEALASLSGTVIAAGEWTFEKITAKKLCVEDVCVDRDQLKNLLDNNSPKPALSIAPQEATDGKQTPSPSATPEVSPEITLMPAAEIIPIPGVTP